MSPSIRRFATSLPPSPDLYDLQHQAGTQEVMTYLDADGVRGSVSYLPPDVAG